MTVLQAGLPPGWEEMDRILLADWRFWGCHGVYPFEWTTPQEFQLDLVLYLQLEPAGRADDLRLTVDYAQIYTQAKQLVEEEHFQLLESLAEELASRVLSYPLVQGVRVKATKCRVQGQDGVFAPAVEICRQREHT